MARPSTETLAAKLERLYATEASHDHLLKTGMRSLDAAEVAYLLNFRDYRNAYREGIPRGRSGWLAKDVRKHLEQDRSAPATARQASTKRASEATAWWEEAG